MKTITVFEEGDYVSLKPYADLSDSATAKEPNVIINDTMEQYWQLGVYGKVVDTVETNENLYGLRFLVDESHDDRTWYFHKDDLEYLSIYNENLVRERMFKSMLQHRAVNCQTYAGAYTLMKFLKSVGIDNVIEPNILHDFGSITAYNYSNNRIMYASVDYYKSRGYEIVDYIDFKDLFISHDFIAEVNEELEPTPEFGGVQIDDDTDVTFDTCDGTDEGIEKGDFVEILDDFVLRYDAKGLVVEVKDVFLGTMNIRHPLWSMTQAIDINAVKLIKKNPKFHLGDFAELTTNYLTVYGSAEDEVKIVGFDSDGYYIVTNPSWGESYSISSQLVKEYGLSKA